MTCSGALFVTFSLTLGYKVPCTRSWLQNLLDSMHSAPHGRGYRGPSLLRGSLLRQFQVDQPYRQQMTCIGAHFITFSFVLGYKDPLGAEPRRVWSTLWVLICLRVIDLYKWHGPPRSIIILWGGTCTSSHPASTWSPAVPILDCSLMSRLSWFQTRISAWDFSAFTNFY